jgi:ATP-dependent Clp protease ATP-binding subunit ClpB
VTFSKLGPEQLAPIVDLQVARLAERLSDRGVSLELSDAARALLAREGYDPAYGARPLKRLVQRRIENPLAQKMLAGEVQEGSVLLVDAEGDELTFTAREAATAGA